MDKWTDGQADGRTAGCRQAARRMDWQTDGRTVHARTDGQTVSLPEISVPREVYLEMDPWIHRSLDPYRPMDP